MASVIKLNDISFGYSKNVILHHVNLAVESGEFVAITGPNGAGKSTLMRIILGLLIPQEGTVELLNEEIGKFTQFDKVGYVPQGGLLNVSDFPATVYEVVALRLGVSMFSRKSRSHIDEKVSEVLKIVDLVGKERMLIKNLSGGQLQRVLIARELIVNPEVIFLDEPTTGLDQNSILNLYTLLNELNHNSGLTVVIVTHHLDQHLGTNVREIIVDQGKVEDIRHV